MNKIYKYPLMITDEQFISMPTNAKILTVQTQKGIPCIWALVNTNFPEKLYKIRIIGTGHPIEESFAGEYISTFQMIDEGLVFHVFLMNE